MFFNKYPKLSIIDDFWYFPRKHPKLSKWTIFTVFHEIRNFCDFSRNTKNGLKWTIPDIFQKNTQNGQGRQRELLFQCRHVVIYHVVSAGVTISAWASSILSEHVNGSTKFYIVSCTWTDFVSGSHHSSPSALYDARVRQRESWNSHS